MGGGGLLAGVNTLPKGPVIDVVGRAIVRLVTNRR